jgi:hypothetical protein
MKYTVALISFALTSAIVECHTIQSLIQSVKDELDKDSVTSEQNVNGILSEINSDCVSAGLPSKTVFKGVKEHIQEKIKHCQSQLGETRDYQALNRSLKWLSGSALCVGASYLLYRYLYAPWRDEWITLANQLTSLGVERRERYRNNELQTVFVYPSGIPDSIKNESGPRLLQLEQYKNYSRGAIMVSAGFACLPLADAITSFRHYLTPDFEGKLKKYKMIDEQLSKFYSENSEQESAK